MKSIGTHKRWLYKIGVWSFAACPLLATVFGVIATYPVKEGLSERRPIVFYFYSSVHENLALIFMLLGLIYILSAALKRNGDQWVIESLQFIVDEYQNKVFKTKGVPLDHNRVTLFKHEKWVVLVRHWSVDRPFWPWGCGGRPLLSSYLVPVLRSGHISKKSRIKFYVSDNGDEAEGVAGMAWASQEVHFIDGLPNIRRDSPKRDIKTYAESTKCDIKMIQKYAAMDKPLPRSIVAIPVERKGKYWGLVVLDSREPDGISDDAVNNYQLTIAMIGRLLEKL